MRLLKDEKLNFEVPNGSSVVMSDEKINEKYRNGEIRIVTEQARYPLNTISAMVQSNSYKLNPEYQRRHRWSNERRSLLIESLIMNVPLPPIFLYEYEYSSYEVMDGLQRLTAIASFYENNFALEGLTKWPELNGKKYMELPKVVQQGIDRRYISSIILLHETAKNDTEADNLKQMVFDRINSGGENLTPQEKRNVNYDGKLNKVCIKLSKNDNLCNAWGIPKDNKSNGEIQSDRAKNVVFKTMGDVELVLRFFAHRQRYTLQKGAALESYLDLYLEHGNAFSQKVLTNLEKLFVATIKLAVDLFGEKVFYLYRERKSDWVWYERPTVAIYDPLMFVLSKNLDNSKALRTQKDELNSGLTDFYKANYNDFEDRNTNPSALKKRDTLFENYVKRFL